MAINRAQLAKELEPGLNALFGMEYARYENEHAEIFDQEASDRAFEEALNDSQGDKPILASAIQHALQEYRKFLKFSKLFLKSLILKSDLLIIGGESSA